MAAPRKCTPSAWKLTKTDRKATIATAKLRVDVDLTTGAVAFFDAAGRPIAAERAGGRSLTPATVMGEATHHVRQQWQAYDGERLYGLGQHQQGLVDIKGTDLELRQYNGEIFIPLLVSSRGYGILWDNTSLTRFGRTEPPVWEEIPGTATGAADWTRTFTATVAGDYQLRTYSAGDIQVDADRADRGPEPAPVIEHWRQGWLPGEDVAHLRLQRGPERQAAVPLEGGHRRQDRPLRDHAAARRRRADVALVRGRRRRRLLVHLRAGAGRRGRRLPPDHRHGADDAALGVRPLAVPRALQDGGGERRGAGRVSQARHPRRRHRAGLAVLAPRRMGLAQVRSGALPRPGALGRRDPRPARPRHDLRLAEVLSRHGQLQGAARRPASSTRRTSSRASRTG